MKSQRGRISQFLSLSFLFSVLIGACSGCLLSHLPAPTHPQTDSSNDDVAWRIDVQKTNIPDGGIPLTLGVLEYKADVNERSIDIALQVMESFSVNSQISQILIIIDSGGGYSNEGIKLVHAIEHSPKRVTCIAQQAQSEGFAIFESCDNRILVRNAVLMVHEPLRIWTREDIDPNWGLRITRSWLEDQMELHDRDTNEWLPAATKKMTMPYADIAAKVRNSDWVLSEDEALKWHAVDAVVDSAIVVELDMANNLPVHARVR